jgi:integrase
MNTIATYSHQPWNKGKIVGQKAPLRVRDIWAIRVRLQLAEKTRDLALFNLAIDSKLRACDLTKLRVRDIAHGERVSSRAIVMQQKTQHPVQFEITEQTRTVVEAWMHQAHFRSEDFLFPTRLHDSEHLSTRQYARIVKAWVTAIGLDATMYGTHTLRRTKASLIYRRTKNLTAVQLLLGCWRKTSRNTMGRLSLGPLAKTAWIRESEGGAHFWGPRAASSRTESLKQLRYGGVSCTNPRQPNYL